MRGLVSPLRSCLTRCTLVCTSFMLQGAYGEHEWSALSKAFFWLPTCSAACGCCSKFPLVLGRKVLAMKCV